MTTDWPHTLRVEGHVPLVRKHQPDVILLDHPELAEALRAQVPSLRYELVQVFPWRRPWSTLEVRRQ